MPNEVGEFAREDLLHWRGVLLHQSGKSWARRQAMFHVAEINSGTGYAGYSDVLHAPVVLVLAMMLMSGLHCRLTPTPCPHCMERPKMPS